MPLQASTPLMGNDNPDFLLLPPFEGLILKNLKYYFNVQSLYASKSLVASKLLHRFLILSPSKILVYPTTVLAFYHEMNYLRFHYIFLIPAHH